MWQTLAALGVVAAMVGVLALLVTTPAMAVREIRIEGADRVSESEIRGALHDIEGTPIALVRPDEVRERLAQFSALQTVAVDLAPPSTMIVRVHERIPVARTADGELVDAAGVRMGAPREGEDSLPVLVDIELGSPEFEAVAHVLRNLAPDLLARTEQVSAASDSDIELVLHGGQRIVWGSRDETALKSAAALVLLDHEVSEGRVIDVTAPGHPVVR